MMTFAWIFLWYATGFIGCTLGLYADYRNGGDTTVSDIMKTLVCSALGPIILLVGGLYFLSNTSFVDKVVFKGRD